MEAGGAGEVGAGVAAVISGSDDFSRPLSGAASAEIDLAVEGETSTHISRKTDTKFVIMGCRRWLVITTS
jgi:hypothetical protein